ncbi:unnamed protein product [Phyllotreta striolata]|uniref:Gustatory receptor n=1 Tax=Phyllotreta striolata TaxID=444603 RepID=A0A9P0DGJ8_PHYSR|nr:unnamed protein product [Phyllotreta striolata]
MVYVVAGNKILDSIRSKNAESRNFHNSLRYFLVISQAFGLLPVENIRQPHQKLQFRWKSFKVLYTCVLILLTGFFILTTFFVYKHGYNLSDLGTFNELFYHSGTIVTLILYLRLARKWPNFAKCWCRMDKIMARNYNYPKKLDKRLRICTAICLTLSIVDYISNVYCRYHALEKTFGENYNYKIYYEHSFHKFFKVIPINIFTASYCSLITFHATLVQAINDLFIILFSVVLALRFKQITQRLEGDFPQLQEKPQEYWMEIREDYDRLSTLCKELDDHVSYIVLLSYSTNIFFLLVQLYNSLELVMGAVGKIYFVFSFVHLIFRIVFVSLHGAWINDESLGPVNILNSISSKCYNIEVRRLLMQIGFDNVALTGCRMFKITRGIILSIAGAVVTYELVLIQFNVATTEAN